MHKPPRVINSTPRDEMFILAGKLLWKMSKDEFGFA
jgi:hypothetical protein